MNADFQDFYFYPVNLRPISYQLPEKRGGIMSKRILIPLIFLYSLLSLNGLAFGEESTPFDYALFGDEFIKMSGNALTDSYDAELGPYSPSVAGEEGDIRSNDDITLSGNARVKGDATYGPNGSFKINGNNAMVTGTTTQIPEILALESVRIPEGVPNSGSLKLSGKKEKTLEAGTYWYSEIKISGKARLYLNGKVKIYCSGNINLSGDAFVNGGSPVNLEIYCLDESKKVDLTGKSKFYGLIYAPAAYINVSGNHNTYGALIGDQIKVSGNGKIHYDKAVGRAHEKVPPVITNLIPEPDSLINDNRPSISADYYDERSGIDINSVRITLDGEDVTSLSIITEEKVSYTPGTELEDGLHNVMVEVKDKAGNSAQANWSFTVDATPPLIDITQPLDGSTISTNAPLITITYNDAESGVNLSSLQILINGADKTSLFTVTDTQASCQIPETDPLPEGESTIQASISDLAGNQSSTSSTFTVQTDITPPDINIIQPVDGSIIATNTPLITITYNDAESGVDLSSLQVLINGTDKTPLFTITDHEATYQILEADPLPEGENTISASIYDQAGNQASTSSTFTIDVTPPTITNLIPEPDSLINQNRPTVSANYQDDLSGIDTTSVRITLDGEDITSFSTITETQVSYVPDTKLEDGIHEVTVEVKDKAGNSAQADWSFTVDTTPPLITNLIPIPNSETEESMPLIQAAYSDLLSGIDTTSVRIILDGDEITALVTITETQISYTLQTELSDGSHNVTVEVKDRAGNSAQAKWSFAIVKEAPTIELWVWAPVYGPPEMIPDGKGPFVPVIDELWAKEALIGGKFWFFPGPVTLGGYVDDLEATVIINGRSVEVLQTDPLYPDQIPGPGPGYFVADSDELGLELNEGANIITAMATNKAGRSSQDSVKAILDTTPPVVKITQPHDRETLSELTTPVTGTVQDEHPLGFFLDLEDYYPLEDETFRVEEVSLWEGQTGISILTIDQVGNWAEDGVEVFASTNSPKVTITSPSDSITVT